VGIEGSNKIEDLSLHVNLPLKFYVLDVRWRGKTVAVTTPPARLDYSQTVGDFNRSAPGNAATQTGPSGLALQRVPEADPLATVLGIHEQCPFVIRC
jgi:hypothetical protein